MKASKLVCRQSPSAIRAARGVGTRIRATSPTIRNANSSAPFADRLTTARTPLTASLCVEGWQSRSIEWSNSRGSFGLDDFVGHERADLVEHDPLLLARVAVTHGHGLILQRLPVDREAVRRARLVHARVALADRLLDVELDDVAAA